MPYARLQNSFVNTVINRQIAIDLRDFDIPHYSVIARIQHLVILFLIFLSKQPLIGPARKLRIVLCGLTHHFFIFFVIHAGNIFRITGNCP